MAADFWSQFPTSGPGAPTYQPISLNAYAPSGGQNDPIVGRTGPTMSGGSPGGPIDFNDPTGIVSAPESGNTWATVGERNRALYGPGSPLGGSNGITDFGPSSWSFTPTPGNPVGTLTGPYGGQKSTLGEFLSNPQAMQSVGGMARNIGGLFGNRPAQQKGGMMPMRGMFGSTMGGGMNPWHQASQYAQSVGATAPMNPWHQAGQAARVMMRAPDGTTQSVDPAHVDHYTGLGAQVINGSSYGGGGY